MARMLSSFRCAYAATLLVSALASWSARASDGDAPFVPPSSNPANLTVLGDTVYFGADDGAHGRELWASDGQRGHARMVADYRTGQDSSDPKNLQVLGGRLLFVAAAEPQRPHELSCLLGPHQIGTVKRLEPRPEGRADLEFMGTSSRRAYLTANIKDFGREVWSTDGTAEGTALVKDLRPGPFSSEPGYEKASRCAVVGDNLYFLAYWSEVQGRGVAEPGLWRTDGTASGTSLVCSIFEQSDCLTAFDGNLVLKSSDGVHGRELWVSDGTKAGTRMLVDINPGAGDSWPSQFYVFGDRILFQATEPEHGAELWSSDGTPEGTHLLKDITPGVGLSDPYGFVACGSRVFFTATTPDTGHELWVTDGTTEGTRLVKDVYRGPRDSNPYQMRDVNGVLFFCAADGVHGEELWRSDGTEEGTRMVKDINPGLTNSEPFGLVNLNGVLLFAASDPTHGRELWRSDGTEEGTAMLEDIYREPFTNPSSSPTRLTAYPNGLYFVVNDIVHGAELWKQIYGSVEPELVRDIFPGPASSSPEELVVSGDELYFRADDGGHGPELWRSDGTLDNTIMVRDIIVGPEGACPKWITAGPRGGVYFAAHESGTGEELWWASGQSASLVADIVPGPKSSSPHNLVRSGDFVYFCADDGIHGDELWCTNGTLETTRLVKDIVPVPFLGASARDLTAAPEGVYFTADDVAQGRWLWRSDGTVGGTQRVVASPTAGKGK